MKYVLTVLSFLFVFAVIPCFAGEPVALDTPLRTLSVSSSVVAFDPAFSDTELPAYPARRGWKRVVLLTVQGGDVYVRFDGSDPSGSGGHHIQAGSHMIWTPGMTSKARWIRVDGDALIVATEAAIRTGGL